MTPPSARAEGYCEHRRPRPLKIALASGAERYDQRVPPWTGEAIGFIFVLLLMPLANWLDSPDRPCRRPGGR